MYVWSTCCADVYIIWGARKYLLLPSMVHLQTGHIIESTQINLLFGL